MPKKSLISAARKVGQYKFDIFTLTTATNISTSSGYQDEAIKVEYFDSCADQHHQLIPSKFDILTLGGEEKIFCFHWLLLFDLQPHHICNKGNPCKDWFYCVIEEHIGNLYCIGKQRKLGVENMNSVTLYMGTFNGNQYGWTGFCFIHFLIYAKKTPGTSMYQDWYACFVIWKTRIHVYSFLIGLISSWRHFSNVLGVLFLSGYFYLFDIYTKKSCKQDLSPFWFCHTIYIFAVCINRRTVSCCCSFE